MDSRGHFSFVIVIFLLLLITLGCKKKESSNVNLVNGVYYNINTGLRHSGYARYIDSNNVSHEGMMANGLFHGSHSLYSNGVLILCGQMNFGQRDDIWYAFYSNQVIRESAEYVDGVKNGFRRIYWEQGPIMLQGTYYNDRLYGKVAVHHNDGFLKETVEISDLDSIYFYLANR